VNPSQKLHQFIENKLKGRVPVDITQEAINLVHELYREEQVTLANLNKLAKSHEVQAI